MAATRELMTRGGVSMLRISFEGIICFSVRYRIQQLVNLQIVHRHCCRDRTLNLLSGYLTRPTVDEER